MAGIQNLIISQAVGGYLGGQNNPVPDIGQGGTEDAFRMAFSVGLCRVKCGDTGFEGGANGSAGPVVVNTDPLFFCRPEKYP
jgi:hypothetical protein